MSIDPLTKGEQLVLPFDKRYPDQGSTSDSQKDQMKHTLVPNLPEFPAYFSKTRSRLLPGDLRLWLILLVVICFVALGSFSFTSASSSPSPTSMQASAGGACTATPLSIHYQPSLQSSFSMPSTWSKTGKNLQDFSNAQACASAFTLAYQSFTSSNLHTLIASFSMLSEGAQQRFYGRAPHSQPDKRLDANWQATIQQEHLQRSAQVQIPKALTDQVTSTGKILIWLAVPYTLTTSVNGNTFIVNATVTVLLVNTIKGTGWQVSAWQDGQKLFNPPSPL